MAARGVASERMAVMEAASGFGRIDLALGLAALDTAVQHGSSSVLGVVPVTWSRFLGTGEVPALLSAFASKGGVVGDVGGSVTIISSVRRFVGGGAGHCEAHGGRICRRGRTLDGGRRRLARRCRTAQSVAGRGGCELDASEHARL